METTIGKALGDSTADRARVAIFGALVIGSDLSVAAWVSYPFNLEAHWALAMVAVIAQLLLVQGDSASVGLVGRPCQGWMHWIGMTIVLGLAVLVIIVISAWVLKLTGRELPVHTTSPVEFSTHFLRMCVFAPVQEEATYRMVLCVSFVRLLGPSGTILVSGVAFGALHVVYGVPSPENLIGGVFLAWSFLKSGTMVVPLVLHSLGNFVVLLAQLAGWWLLQ